MTCPSKSNPEIITADFVKKVLPERPKNSNKGSFGKISLFVGGKKYFGASALALEAALRGGVGYTTLFGEREQNRLLKLKFPEALYKERKPFSEMTDADIEEILATPEAGGNIVIGCGAEASLGLARLLIALLNTEGGFILIDADAINSLSYIRAEAFSAIRNSKRRIIFTPHHMELSRISGIDIEKINEDRVSAARCFYSEIESEHVNHILLLKGAGTLVLCGDRLYINSSGSSALAKAGSGDVLAGLIGAMVAQNPDVAPEAVAASTYLHGAAADTLSASLSEFGVTPSDLPIAIAKEIKSLI